MLSSVKNSTLLHTDANSRDAIRLLGTEAVEQTELLSMEEVGRLNVTSRFRYV